MEAIIKDEEIVAACDLRRGDSIWRYGLVRPGWAVVLDVICDATDRWPGDVIRITFADAPDRLYLPESTFRRRVDRGIS